MKEKVEQWRPLAEKWSRQTGTPAALILATVEQESGGDPRAIRYEMGYEQRYVINNAKNLWIAEECGLTTKQVATSYGLMQLMFPLAYGYGARTVLALLDPGQNIRFGSAHLGALISKYRESEVDAVCIRKVAGDFNGAGSASAYARNIYALYLRYEAWLKGMQTSN